MTLPFLCDAPPTGDDGGKEIRTRLQIVPSETAAHHSQEDSSTTDTDIIKRLRAGDEGTFDALYLSHYSKLLIFATRLLRGIGGADDVVQEVFASLWTRREQLTIHPPIRAYLYGAVRNRAFLVSRRDATATRLQAAHATAAEPLGMSARQPTADEQLDAADTAQALQAVIDGLPERQRLALELWLRDRLDPPDIAVALGISAVAVRKLLAKAHGRLRAVLETRSR